MTRQRGVHIVTDYGVEGWVPDPHRWDGVIVIAVVLGVLVLGAALGWLAAIEYVLGWVRG